MNSHVDHQKTIRESQFRTENDKLLFSVGWQHFNTYNYTDKEVTALPYPSGVNYKRLSLFKTVTGTNKSFQFQPAP